MSSKTAPKACEHDLKEKMPEYQKGNKGFFATLEPKLEEAKLNAIKALKDARTTNEPNPSTEIHLLVEYLQNIKETS